MTQTRGGVTDIQRLGGTGVGNPGTTKVTNGGVSGSDSPFDKGGHDMPANESGDGDLTGGTGHDPHPTGVVPGDFLIIA